MESSEEETSVPSTTTRGNVLDEDNTLLAALIESDQLGPVFKETFGSNKAQEARMMGKLDAIMKSKQNELHQICSSHYQEFVTCVDHLLELRADTSQLHHNLTEFQESLEDTGERMLSQGRRYVELLRIAENMRIARRHMEECLGVFHKTAQIQQSLQKKMHILALRQVEELQESSGLQKMSSGAEGYEWAKFYSRQVIPAIRLLIRQSATDKFNEWLYIVRDLSPRVGGFALAQAASQQRAHATTEWSNPTMDTTTRSTDRCESFLKGYDPRQLEDGIFDHVRVDFTPVYQCLHIHDMLSLRAQFQQYYSENRKLQCNLALQSGSDFLGTGNTQKGSFAKYFSHLAGFFIIEDRVYKTTTSFLRRRTIEELWSTSTLKVASILSELLSHRAPDDLTHLMDAVVLFTNTMKLYSYDVTQWLDMLSDISGRCIAKLLDEVNYQLREILDNEKYEPLRIDRKSKLYRKLISTNGLEEEDQYQSDETGSQVVFTFSKALPLICNLIKEFSQRAYVYSRYASKSDEQLSHSMEQLVQHIRNSIQSSIEESYSHANIAQLIQIHQNLSRFIRYMSQDFEQILMGLQFSSTIAKRISKSAIASLLDAQRSGQDKLVELCDDKIATFLSLTDDTDWLPAQASAEPHAFVQEFIIYLEAIYQMMRPLSRDLQQSLLVRIHNFIGKCLLRPLTENEFNLHAVEDLQSDVRFLTQFAEEAKFKDLVEEGFLEVRQTTNLLMEQKPDIFLHEARDRYDAICPELLQKILRRYRPNSRLKKKLVSEVAVKRLADGLATLS